MNIIGIRSEEKHWDSRATISPEDIKSLPNAVNLQFESDGERTLPFKRRVFSDQEILAVGKQGGAGTAIIDTLNQCAVIIGTKEIKEVALKLADREYAWLTENCSALKHRIPYFAFDEKLKLAALTDFLSEDEKQTLRQQVAGTPAERLIATLLAEQEHLIEPGKTYLFFSHTHKGQAYNMRMLQQFIARECTLIDYELLRETTSGGSRRTVAYSGWAGIIGALDALWTYGEHLYRRTGIDTPFRKIRSEAVFDPEQFEYRSLKDLQLLIKEIGAELSDKGLPEPMVVGLTGSRGRVGHGVLEVLENWGLPMATLAPSRFSMGTKRKNLSTYKIHLLKLDYEHLYRPKFGEKVTGERIRTAIQSGRGYLLESNLDQFFPELSIFMNCIVWHNDSPRLLTNAYLKHVFDTHTRDAGPILPVIGDISCDPCGSIQCCRDTYPNQPAYIWSPVQTDEPILPDTDLKKADPHYPYFDLSKAGFPVMAVTNLPCEIPRDASLAFSRAFCQRRASLGDKSYLQCLAEADLDKEFSECGLPQPLKDAVILYRGRFIGANQQLSLKEICLAMIETGTIDPRQILPVVAEDVRKII